MGDVQALFFENALKISQSSLSLGAGLSAFCIWGSLVLYWKALGGVASFEILLHRMSWSLITVFILVLFLGSFGEIRAALHDKKMFIRIFIASSIIAGNWLLYIWCVNNGHVVEASLGYFVNPLLSVVIGRVFLKEKLTRLQLAAIVIAALGVCYSIVAYGKPPWISLILAASFATYGYLKKTIQLKVVTGFFWETAMLFPVAASLLVWQEASNQSHFFAYDLQTQLLLMSSGIITALPLLLFAYASQHLQLATMGLMQYIAPSINLILGVYIFQETISDANMVMLITTWFALALYTWCNIDQYRKLHKNVLTAKE